MVAPDTWSQQIQLFMYDLNISNIVWPGYGDALASNWPDLATLLSNHGIPAVDFGGFVPGGMQDFDAHAAPQFAIGRKIVSFYSILYDCVQ